ncbi:MAG TPA: VOC family protein [Kofleriaceae bacterium]|nr:VOC family protein [Kofleriaceae bacterium]
MSRHIDFLRLDHFAITVRDIEKSASWYRTVLGFEIFHKWDNAWMLRRGDVGIGLYTSAAQGPAKPDEQIAIQHVAFRVTPEHYQTAQATLTALGVPFDPPHDTGVSWTLFFKDPDGHRIELTYYHKPSA